jgi:hypothetical protein
MEQPPEQKPLPGTKRSFFWNYFILTPASVLFLYVLSLGPVFMLMSKGSISTRNQSVRPFYYPVLWAYNKTPLHKPLGLYFRLWAPTCFDKNGNDLPMPIHKVNRSVSFVNPLALAARRLTPQTARHSEGRPIFLWAAIRTLQIKPPDWRAQFRA